MTSANRAIRPLAGADAAALAAFLAALSVQDRALFHPHGFDAETARRICEAPGRDVFLGGFQAGGLAAYGLLRGWQEGFAVPRIGLATHPDHRGQGWGAAMIDALHRVAAERGASRTELKVDAGNAAALHLYRAKGYRFPAARAAGAELVGWRAP